MTEIEVLTCPVCGRSGGFTEEGAADRTSLKDEAWAHLESHRLDESKRAIYTVMMVERRDRVTVEALESFDRPTGRWVEELPDVLA